MILVGAALVVVAAIFVDVRPTLGVKVAAVRLLPISELTKAQWIEVMCRRTFLESYLASRECLEAYTTKTQQTALADRRRSDMATQNICEQVLHWIKLARDLNFDPVQVSEDTPGLTVAYDIEDDRYLMFKTEGERTFAIFYSPRTKDLAFGETISDTIAITCP
jgi:hypothetical protein